MQFGAYLSGELDIVLQRKYQWVIEKRKQRECTVSYSELSLPLSYFSQMEFLPNLV